jgi:hypothetical protein
MTAHDYMNQAYYNLMEQLDIELNDKDKLKKLAPFASVWAAMIAAAAADFETAARCSNYWRDHQFAEEMAVHGPNPDDIDFSRLRKRVLKGGGQA